MALKSALNQSSEFDEIVIVDDDSIDQTLSLLYKFVNQLDIHFQKKIKICNHVNIGTYENFKLGLKILNTDYAMGLAGDDLLPHTCVSTVKKYLPKLRQNEILVGKLLPYEKTEIGTIVRLKNTYVSGFTGISKLDFNFLKTGNISPGGGVIYPRKAVIEVLGNHYLGKVLWEDWLIFYILVANKFKFLPSNGITYHYLKDRFHKGVSMNKKIINDNRIILQKYFQVIENSKVYNEKNLIIKKICNNILFKKIIIRIAHLRLFIFYNELKFKLRGITNV